MRRMLRSQSFRGWRRLCTTPASRFAWAAKSDRGSGTVVGAALILLIGALLSAMAVGGQLLICRARAESAADSAALAVAAAHYDGASDPCGVVGGMVNGYGASPRSCSIDGMDAEVTVTVGVGVPLMPEVTARSRAGPESCS